MLICPICEFENPNSNKFCQSCGTSLIEKPCHECGTKVKYNAEKCHNCGAVTGTFWLALVNQFGKNETASVAEETLTENINFYPDTVIQKNTITLTEEVMITPEIAQVDAKEETQAIEEVIKPAETVESKAETKTTTVDELIIPEEADDIDSEEAEPELKFYLKEKFFTASITRLQIDEIESVPPEEIDFQLNGEFLDKMNRYKLTENVNQELSKVTIQEDGSLLLETIVGDTDPLKTSRLAEILKTQGNLSAKIQENIDNLPGLEAEMGTEMKLQKIAIPYLIYQEFSSRVPQVHDAWAENNQEVVLLEDRSKWQSLSDLLKNQNIELGQIFEYLYQITELWQNLSYLGYCQTVLEPNNLKVDEELSLCVQKLIPDLSDSPATLQDLGIMWQSLLFSCEIEDQTLVKLFELIETGEINQIEELYALLRQILEEETSATSTPEEYEEEYGEIANEIAVDDFYDEEEMSYSDEGDDMPTVVVPMQLASITEAACTDIGRQRFHNEDFYGIETKSNRQENPQGKKFFAQGLYVVCDGMGGHAAGEIASAMAVQTLAKYFQNHWQSDKLPDETTIREGILHANATIYNVNLENARSGSGRMGTTLVMAMVQNTNVAIAHVGDSRAYAITRKFGLEQLTVDHEVGQLEIQRGVESEIAYARPDAYQLTQALGPRGNDYIKPDVNFLELKEDTLILLCSDGLSDNDFIENNWQTYLEPLISSKANLQHGLEQFIDFANEQNGHDNITGLIIRVKLQPDVSQKSLF